MKCLLYFQGMDDLLELCKQLYELPGCAAGGCLHILLDDNNFDDDDILFCRDYAKENAGSEGELELSVKICDEYLRMTMMERTMFNWYWNGSDLECSPRTPCDTCMYLRDLYTEE